MKNPSKNKKRAASEGRVDPQMPLSPSERDFQPAFEGNNLPVRIYGHAFHDAAPEFNIEI